jgi:hypothetical protein
MKKSWILTLVIVPLFLAGCTKTASATLPTLTVPPQGTAAPILATATPMLVAPLQTPAPTVNPATFTPFPAEPLVDTLKLRVGPGYLFDALILINQGESVQVQGKAPGGEWINVETEDGTRGWVFAQLLKSDRDLQAIPVIQPQDVTLIKGKITDITGLPISGALFALVQGEERNEAVSDASGEFFAFFSTEASGEWAVSFESTSCPSNVWQDAACTTYKNGYTGTVDPASLSITLPQDGTLTFLWR